MKITKQLSENTITITASEDGAEVFVLSGGLKDQDSAEIRSFRFPPYLEELCRIPGILLGTFEAYYSSLNIRMFYIYPKDSNEVKRLFHFGYVVKRNKEDTDHYIMRKRVSLIL